MHEDKSKAHGVFALGRRREEPERAARCVGIEPRVAWTLVAALFVILVALTALASTVPDLFDPCHEWGLDGNQDRSARLDESCPSRSGSSQTRAEAVFQLVAIHGVLLLAAGMLIVGATRAERTWTAGGATLLLSLVPPFGLGFFWVPILATAVALFVGAARLPPKAGPRGGTGAGSAYAVAGLGVALVVVFLWSEGATWLALVAGVFGLVGIGIMVMLGRRGPASTA